MFQHWQKASPHSPYELFLSSGVLWELEKSTLVVGLLLDTSTSSLGREMAFLMMGEMAGGGGDRSFDPSLGRLSEPLLICRSVLVKNAPILLSGEETESVSPLFSAAVPPWLLRKDVSPKTSPPRPTCMVCRKSPSGGLIMSTVRSPLWRRLLWECETRPLRPDSFSWRFMITKSQELF